MTEDRSLEAKLTSQRVEAGRRKLRTKAVVDIVGASPPAKQAAFLRGLLSDPEEAKAFLEGPEQYASARGMVVDPELVRGMVDTLVFEEPMSERLVEHLGPDVTAELLELRGDGKVAALPIAVATVVAVASAAVALVAQSSTSMSVGALKGLTKPSAAQFVTASSAIVVAYAVTTVTAAAAALVASSDKGVLASRIDRPLPDRR